MKKIVLVVLALCVCATPVLASRTVYLKEGGTISAKSVWRTKGKVHVLVNRDTLAEFSASEIDLKRTFSLKRHVPRKPAQKTSTTRSAEISTDNIVMEQK